MLIRHSHLAFGAASEYSPAPRAGPVSGMTGGAVIGAGIRRPPIEGAARAYSPAPKAGPVSGSGGTGPIHMMPRTNVISGPGSSPDGRQGGDQTRHSPAAANSS